MIDTQGNITPHLNTGECRNPDRAKQIYTRPDIRVAYLMGEGHDWIDHALAHCELVIVRIFDMFNDGGHQTDADATIYTRHTKEEVFTRIDSAHRKYRNNPRVKWVISNEPSTNEGTKFNRKYMLDWHADVGRYMAERGYGTALGGIAMSKTNGLPFHNGSDWNKILQTCADFPEWVILDIHEYAFLMQAAGHLKTYYKPFPEMYLDRQSMHPNNWGKIDYETGNTDDNWHVGNIASLSKYNREVLKLPQFWYGRGECGFDYVVEAWWKDWVDHVYTPKYGIKPEGMHNLRPYWADILHGIPVSQYTDVLFNQDAILNASYLKLNCGKGCLYNAHFSYNTNSYWVDDDISRPDTELYIHWMEYGQHEVIPLHIASIPVPAPTPAPRTLRPIRMQGCENTINLRDKPSVTGNKIGELPQAPVVTPGYVETGDGEYINPFTWKWYEFKDASGKDLKGYMASDLIAEVTSEPPAPQPDYKAIALSILRRERQNLVNEVAEYAERILDIDRQIAELDKSA